MSGPRTQCVASEKGPGMLSGIFAGASLGQADVPSTHCVLGPLYIRLKKEASGNQIPVSSWHWLGAPLKPSGCAAPVTTTGFSVQVSSLLRPQLSQLAEERLKGKVEALLTCRDNHTGSQEMWVLLHPHPRKIWCPPVYPLSHGISLDRLLYGRHTVPCCDT